MSPKMPGLEAALRDLQKLDGVQVTSGLQGTAVSGEATGGELVEIGTAHEYGLGVPERPFMSTSVRRYGLEWVVGWDAAVRAATDGERARMVQALKLTGLRMVSDIQQTITEGPWSPNSEETQERKRRGTPGEVRPLIDTGQMRQSIRSQVEVPGSAPVVVG